MNRLPLSDEQYQIMQNDLDVAQPVSELLPYINDPSYKGQLLYFARLMAYKDGVLHPSEEELIQKFHGYATDNLDVESIRKDVQAAVQQELLIQDIKIPENRPRKGDHFIPWLQWLDEILLSLGIDLLR